ncbi:MAG TPA: hypothetical protein VNG04_13865 [Candidatus Acidoferrum sp.]|nr:hypothetical protein [Candidatus Acidoferrum sp.]
MPDLEQQLSSLGAALEWPPTPDIHLPALLEGRAPLTAPWWGVPVSRMPRWVLAAAAAVVIAAAGLAVYPPSREAIANWVNVHTSFQRVTHLATPTPQPPGPLGARLGLGGKTSLPNAQKQVAWHIVLPSGLGEPDEVYLQPPPDAPAQGEVTLAYATRPGIPVAAQTGVSVLVTEARGAVDQNFFGKMIGPDTTFEPVTVDGHQGYWIAGPLHEFFFTDANGGFRSETVRLAANTLILDYGGTVIRIEGNLTKAQAVELAASLA